MSGKNKSKITANEFVEMSYNDIKALANQTIKNRFENFIKEFNRREWSVRIDKSESFQTFKINYLPEFGYGFNDIYNRPVPYFHPNRSFHDEIIWLNKNLFYDKTVNFEDRLINSAIVKFYGPSEALRIASKGTGIEHISVDRYKNDKDYRYKVLTNLEDGVANGGKIWGTTELRTSLQKAATYYCRENPTLIDEFGSIHAHVPIYSDKSQRMMRPSDMIHWIIDGLSDSWIEFYKQKPTMKESFDFLTSEYGIGDYYGYHFSSNLARMPEVGDKTIIEAEFKKEFDALGVKHGNLNENDDFVIAGPGSSATFAMLWPDVQPMQSAKLHAIKHIRDNQFDWFNINPGSNDEKYLKESSEIGRFTTFGIEISMCQFNVFTRCKDSKKSSVARANAPISIDDDVNSCDIGGKKDDLSDEW
jgi:hypothetical protein